LIIFGTNISDPTCHQLTIPFPTSHNVCFDNVGDVFSGFLSILTDISLDMLSLCSAEAYIGSGSKLKGHLLASCVRNILTKNYQNLIGFHVTVKNVGNVF